MPTIPKLSTTYKGTLMVMSVVSKRFLTTTTMTHLMTIVTTYLQSQTERKLYKMSVVSIGT